MTLIHVRVIPGARKEVIEEIRPSYLRVKVQEPPEKGKANDRVVELLAEYYRLPESNIVLKRGARSRDKVFGIVQRDL